MGITAVLQQDSSDVCLRNAASPVSGDKQSKEADEAAAQQSDFDWNSVKPAAVDALNLYAQEIVLAERDRMEPEVRVCLDAFLLAPDDEARQKALSITVGDCLGQDGDIDAMVVTFLKEQALRGMTNPDISNTILWRVSPQTFSQSMTWGNPLRGLCAVDRIVKLARNGDLRNLTLISTSPNGPFDESLRKSLQSGVY